MSLKGIARMQVYGIVYRTLSAAEALAWRFLGEGGVISGIFDARSKPN
jgi:hypothetical protein